MRSITDTYGLSTNNRFNKYRYMLNLSPNLIIFGLLIGSVTATICYKKHKSLNKKEKASTYFKGAKGFKLNNRLPDEYLGKQVRVIRGYYRRSSSSSSGGRSSSRGGGGRRF
jgi:hypothetical protein